MEVKYLTIAASAFSNATQMSQIIILQVSQILLQMPFENCTNLIKLTLSNNLISIGSSAFKGCKFSSITIPNSVTNIDLMRFEVAVI